MIDYIDAIVPLKHNKLIRNGHKTITKDDGTSNEVNYPLFLQGKNGSSIKVQSIDLNQIRVIGNLTMFIQGQSIYGTDDLLALCYEGFSMIAKQLGFKPTKKNLRQWKTGYFKLNTIDVTQNLLLPSQSTVREWLDQAGKSLSSGKQAIETFRSSGSHHIETIYAGRQSNFISVKFYNKFLQLTQGAKNQRKIKAADSTLQELITGSTGLLRVEIRFHKQYLRQQELTLARNLTPEVLREHFKGKLKSLKLGSSKILSDEELNGLNSTQRLAYKLWKQGGDVKDMLPTGTFQRVKSALLSKAINISQPYVKRVHAKSLRYYLKSLNVAKVPDFLAGTDWYFDPE
jgi:II/X family phage/plasmid replication protein